MRVVLITLAVLLLLGCESKEEREARENKARQFVLEQTCVRKHGSPVMENGEFKSCTYNFSGIFHKKTD